ncbi:hypothetical protein FRC06_002975 [Ceratobasidium sp. 370]|nr:hypothetical protein FRC06_002975 [Ceratobasidium sp. 370]
MNNQELCCLSLNPDITGKGVRIALYAQILLGWFVSLKWPDTFAKNARTAYMTAIALLIAAFIQLQTQDLSLLDGIVVSLITTMMITFAISSSPTRSNAQNQPTLSDDSLTIDPNKSLSRFLTQFCFVAFWAAWCLLMWHDPVHFGLRNRAPDCDVNNNVTIMVFGREIHATDPRMQRAALALVSFGIVVAFGSLWISLEGLLGPIIKKLRSTAANITTRDPQQVQKDEDSILKFIRRSLQGLSFGTLIYLIATTEKTIIRNDVTGSSKAWSYGQTIALILLLQQVMDVCSTYVEKRDEEKRNESMTPLPVQPQTTIPPSPIPPSPIPPSPSPQPGAQPAANSGTTQP